MEQKKIGKVWLAGAGPGDVGLLTVKTRELLEQADIIVYDALVSTEILSLISSDKETIYVGKRSGRHSVSQEEINRILLREAMQGKNVLRLKGGDPLVFGRGGEELEMLAHERIPFEVIPGITSASAVPTYAGIPITHRDYASSFHVITGHAKKDSPLNIDYESLVKLDGTLIFLMGIGSLPQICKGLLVAGMEETMPAAVVEKGTTAEQRKIISDLKHIAEDVKKAQIQTPAIIIIGKVCALSKQFDWMFHRPLSGRQFILTRPRQNSASLAKKIRNLGAQVLEIPTIRTVPITDNSCLKTAIEKKAEACCMVFTSVIGVDMFFEKLQRMNMDIRTLFFSKKRIQFAVIGEATGQRLKKYGFYPDIMPDVYDAKNLGKELAKQLSKNSEVLILRAKQGSKELLPPLEKEGFKVEDIPLYDTFYEKNSVIGKEMVTMLQTNSLDAVVFTSGSTVRGFVEMVQDKEILHGLSTVCIGAHTAEVAKKNGMSVQIAKKATEDSVVECILQNYGRYDAC